MAGILVIGGGVAGLVCAWRLQRAGHHVEVLELRPSIGGRLRGESWDGFRLPTGASHITSGQANTTSVLSVLGLEQDLRALDRGQGAPPGEAGAAEPAPGRLPGAIVCGQEILPLPTGRRGLFGSGLGPSRVVPLRSLPHLVRFAGELVRRRDRLDPVLPERAARLENGESMPRYAARLAGEPVSRRLLTPLVECALGCEAEDVSSAFLLLALRTLSQGPAPLSLTGGLDRLPRLLAVDLPVRTGCEVFSVEGETGGARVRYRATGRERTAVADAVVVAVPGPVVPLICPKLTPDERGFFETVGYAPGMSVHVPLERPPTLEHFALAFARDPDVGLRALFQTHRIPGTVPDGAGLLTLELTEPVIRRFAHAPDRDIAAFALAQLSRLPIGRIELRGPAERTLVVQRFEHARPIFPRGALSRLENFRVRIERSARLVFAGDYLVAPTVEGALTSGMQAASRVIQSLDAT